MAVLKSRAEETKFFVACLADRIVYAHRLGLVDKLPRRDEAVLDIGREITLADVEELLQRDVKESSGQDQLPAVSNVAFAYDETVDKSGKRMRLINPDLPEAERRLYERAAEAEGVRIMDIEKNPLRRGELFHGTSAERYPHLRWNFAWGKYAVVGVADGLTKEFVYEYKTTRERYLLSFVKPVALEQPGT